MMTSYLHVYQNECFQEKWQTHCLRQLNVEEFIEWNEGRREKGRKAFDENFVFFCLLRDKVIIEKGKRVLRLKLAGKIIYQSLNEQAFHK